MRPVALTVTVFLLALALPAATQENPDAALIKLLRQAASETDSFGDRFDAQVWLTDMSARLQRQVVDPQERIEILRRGLAELAKHYGYLK